MARAHPPAFPPQTLTFLRKLARNNDREWFRARKDDFTQSVKTPMLAVLEALDHELRSLAPELDASPKSLYRIYRDTRFSADKTPLKTHVAASINHRVLGKSESAGLYLHVEPKQVLFAGGLYAPSPTQLRTVRAAIAAHASQFRSLVLAPAFARAMTWEGEPQTRVPRGYAADHPAAEFLKSRRFVAWAEYPADLATSPRFFSTMMQAFTLLTPLVRFINDALLQARRMEIR